MCELCTSNSSEIKSRLTNILNFNYLIFRFGGERLHRTNGKPFKQNTDLD